MLPQHEQMFTKLTKNKTTIKKKKYKREENPQSIDQD